MYIYIYIVSFIHISDHASPLYIAYPLFFLKKIANSPSRRLEVLVGSGWGSPMIPISATYPGAGFLNCSKNHTSVCHLLARAIFFCRLEYLESREAGVFSFFMMIVTEIISKVALRHDFGLDNRRSRCAHEKQTSPALLPSNVNHYFYGVLKGSEEIDDIYKFLENRRSVEL